MPGLKVIVSSLSIRAMVSLPPVNLSVHSMFSTVTHHISMSIIRSPFPHSFNTPFFLVVSSCVNKHSYCVCVLAIYESVCPSIHPIDPSIHPFSLSSFNLPVLPVNVRSTARVREPPSAHSLHSFSLSLAPGSLTQSQLCLPKSSLQLLAIPSHNLPIILSHSIAFPIDLLSSRKADGDIQGRPGGGMEVYTVSSRGSRQWLIIRHTLYCDYTCCVSVVTAHFECLFQLTVRR